MKITAVIPTRNRADDLCITIKSIFQQTMQIDELLVIDQSADTTSVRSVARHFLESESGITLRHIHDPSITGLVEAKHVAAGLAAGELVLFLEDDVTLKPDYVEQIALGFEQKPQMLGCCGVVEKVAISSSMYRVFFRFFHRGIFYDERINVHGNLHDQLAHFIQSRFISGGVSAWRKEVLEIVPFDLKNDFFMLEDIDFSSRAVRAFGEDKFFINTRAVLDHRMSPANREKLQGRYQRKLREFLIFYKKNRDLSWATLSMIWLLVGLGIEAAIRSAQIRSLRPAKGFCRGTLDGFSRPVLDNETPDPRRMG